MLVESPGRELPIRILMAIGSVALLQQGRRALMVPSPLAFLWRCFSSECETSIGFQNTPWFCLAEGGAAPRLCCGVLCSVTVVYSHVPLWPGLTGLPRTTGLLSWARGLLYLLAFHFLAVGPESWSFNHPEFPRPFCSCLNFAW